MIQNDKIVMPQYLKFLRDKPCVVIHQHAGKTEVHHLKAVGWREWKRNDLTGIPICRAGHTEIEQIGMNKFEEKHGVTMWKEAFYLFLEYAVKKEWVRVYEK